VGGGICAICCGTEREVTVNCPLDCMYLREARKREPLPEIDPRTFPNNDIKVDEAFLDRNEPLLILLAASLARSALNGGGIVDSDVRDALEGLVRTYRTLQSGLYYDSRPENPLAARIYSDTQEAIEDIRKRLAEQGGLRDADVLGILVFLQRLGIQHDNSRPKGRAFIDFLRQFFPPEHPKESGSLIHTP
jgi:hypothetical protein